MTTKIEILSASNGFGGCLTLRALRFGIPGGRPKVYIQAGTHTEELPGPLVLHHLRQLLEPVPVDDWQGEVILVPFANPLGLSQAISGNPIGRLELATGMNFNLSWPSVSRAKGAGLESTEEELRGASALTTLGQIRLELLRRAHDADVVLDLHCSMEPAVNFAFVDDRHGDDVTSLAAALKLDAVFTVPASSSGTFMEVILNIRQTRQSKAYPDMVATIELRGNRDVDDRLAQADALGLMTYLGETGVFTGCVPKASPGWSGILAPYSATLAVIAEAGGIFLPKTSIRETVKEGQRIGEILVPAPGNGPERIAVDAPCDGLVLTHAEPSRILHPGAPACVLYPSSPICTSPPDYIDIDAEWA